MTYIAYKGTRRLLVGGLVAVFSYVSLGTVEAASPVELTSCNQQVSGRFFLAADLDCSAGVGHGVEFIGNSTLELRGFMLSGATHSGVECAQSCKIFGPGAISGNGLDAIRSDRNATVVGVTISDNGGGLYGSNRVVFVDSSMAGNGEGITASKIKIVSSSLVDGGGRGASGGGPIKIVDSTISNHASYGVLTGRLKVTNSVVNDNGDSGVRALKVRVKDSVLTGNCLAPNTPGECGDVASCDKRPKLRNTTCETSYHCQARPSDWGLCALD